MIKTKRVLNVDETITESEDSHSDSLADSSDSESGEISQEKATDLAQELGSKAEDNEVANPSMNYMNNPKVVSSILRKRTRSKGQVQTQIGHSSIKSKNLPPI